MTVNKHCSWIMGIASDFREDEREEFEPMKEVLLIRLRVLPELVNP
jgi:hypothetical protein